MSGLHFLSARVGRPALAAAICAAAFLVQAGVAGASAGRSDGHMGGALYVSPSAMSGMADHSCGTAAYSTIQSAVSAAPSGGTVIVCPGTYNEHVVITSPLNLIGRGQPTIEASSTDVGSCDGLGPCLAGVLIGSSDVEIRGFTVTGAVGEGILAVTGLGPSPVSNVTITHNRVVGNDTGGIPGAPANSYAECAVEGMVPGDCGEGIHLMGVADSVVSHNFDSGNTGGILLTDETGPTHGNLIEDNTVTGNQYDCGITVPGHNGAALSATGTPQPTVAGVYDNRIINNTVTDNGLLGDGAGVLFANGAPGSASYDNLVEGNYIAGNGLSGVTMHAHTLPPGEFEDLSGNTIIGNTIGENNIDGDGLDGSQMDMQTTGVLVFAMVPVKETIAGNVIFNDTYGIWEGVNGNVTATLAGNQFFGVGTPVFTQP